jgi:hypothetical protein
MKNKLKNNRSEILVGLEKTFYTAWADCYSDQTEFCCQLGPSIKHGVLRFPFMNKDIEKHNPYDIVNTIWEYITDRMP